MVTINTNAHKQVLYTPEIESGAGDVATKLFNRAITKTNELCSSYKEMIMRITVTDDLFSFSTNDDNLVYFMFKEPCGNFFMDEIIVIRAYLIRSIIYTPKMSNCKFRITHIWHQKPNGNVIAEPTRPSMDLIGDLLLNRTCILTGEPFLDPKMSFLNIKKQTPFFEK